MAGKNLQKTSKESMEMHKMILRASINDEECFPNTLFIRFDEDGVMNFSFDDETIQMMLWSDAPSLESLVIIVLRFKDTLKELWDVHGTKGESFAVKYRPYTDSDWILTVECYRENPQECSYTYCYDYDGECFYSEC